MQIKNNYYDYAKKYKNIIRYVCFAIPLILLLLAFVFPIKQVNNTYELENTTTEDTSTTINFNQMIENGNMFTNDNYSSSLGTIINNNNQSITYNYNSYESNYLNGVVYSGINGTLNHIYMIKIDLISNINSRFRIDIFNDSSNSNVIYNGSETLITYNFIVTCINKPNNPVYLYFVNNINENSYFTISNFQVFDLSQMNLEDITIENFNKLFQLNYYNYTLSNEISLSSLTITNNLGNQAGQPLQVNENREVNTSFIQPLNSFYNLSLNNWYRDTLNYMNLTSDNVVTNYLLYYPLWILIVLILDIILDFVLIVPCFVHRIATKFKGD